jgi:hypothetical protein
MVQRNNTLLFHILPGKSSILAIKTSTGLEILTFGPQQRFDAQIALLAAGPQVAPLLLSRMPCSSGSLVSGELQLTELGAFRFQSRSTTWACVETIRTKKASIKGKYISSQNLQGKAENEEGKG